MAPEIRPLGSQGLMCPAQGLGAMGRRRPGRESLRTFDAAVALGVTFIDTAWIYQHPSGATNEALVAKAIAKHGRSKLIIATKCGIVVTPEKTLAYDATEANIRKQLADSLQRLGTDYIDLYYLHRMDPKTPIADVMRTMTALQAEGKIRHIGLSECTAAELRAAAAVAPVAAIQMEWSLQTRDIEAEIVPAARALGVAIVAYSPLGRGFLSRTFASRGDLKEGDWRRTQPRFAEGAFDANAAAAVRLEALAAKKGVTPAQLALAWVHARGKDVFPIPGAKTVAHVTQNAAAAGIALSAEECAELEAAVPPAQGDRYGGMSGTHNSRADV